MICAICGKEGKVHMNTDHIIPRAVFKWNREYISDEEYALLEAQIESDANKVAVHRECNLNKQDGIPDIGKLFIERSRRFALEELLQKTGKYIAYFSEHKRILFFLQDKKCFCCGRAASEGDVLRRIDPMKPRTWDNACLVCRKCNAERAGFTEEAFRARKR